MPHVNELYEKILAGPIDSNLRREILEEIVRCLELKKDTLGTWEKTLFAQSLAYLSINAASTYQPTSLWLRLCLVCLEKAMVPRRERNEDYTVDSETIDSMNYEFLVTEAGKIRWQIGY